MSEYHQGRKNMFVRLTGRASEGQTPTFCTCSCQYSDKSSSFRSKSPFISWVTKDPVKKSTAFDLWPKIVDKVTERPPERRQGSGETSPRGGRAIKCKISSLQLFEVEPVHQGLNPLCPTRPSSVGARFVPSLLAPTGSSRRHRNNRLFCRCG